MIGSYSISLFDITYSKLNYVQYDNATIYSSSRLIGLSLIEKFSFWEGQNLSLLYPKFKVFFEISLALDPPFVLSLKQDPIYLIQIL